MPYVPQDERNLKSVSRYRAGHLNYAITDLCDTYVRLNGLSYATLNEVVGVLECAKLEFVRRIVSPYEDEKIAQNGDVYTCNK